VRAAQQSADQSMWVHATASAIEKLQAPTLKSKESFTETNQAKRKIKRENKNNLLIAR
jgi:hypothetical protein